MQFHPPTHGNSKLDAENYLKPILKKSPFALSMEMRNIDPKLSPKVNSIPDFMKDSKDV